MGQALALLYMEIYLCWLVRCLCFTSLVHSILFVCVLGKKSVPTRSGIEALSSTTLHVACYDMQRDTAHVPFLCLLI